MYRYLNNKEADYTTTIYSVTPIIPAMPQTGEKNQIVHEMDDGSVIVIGISTSNFFSIPLQWKYMSVADHTITMDFWHNELKAAGRRRTFYWAHPKDGKYYTVRFMGPLVSVYNEADFLSVNQILLRVEGNKPA